MPNGVNRCLIVERHDWETGGQEQQLQIPLAAAEDFFGPGNQTSPIQVQIQITRTAAPTATSIPFLELIKMERVA